MERRCSTHCLSSAVKGHYEPHRKSTTRHNRLEQTQQMSTDSQKTGAVSSHSTKNKFHSTGLAPPVIDQQSPPRNQKGTGVMWAG